MAYRFKSVDAQPLRHRPQRRKVLTHPATPFLVLLLVAVAILGCGPDPTVTPNQPRTTVQQKNNALHAEEQPSFWDHDQTVPKPVSTESHFIGAKVAKNAMLLFTNSTYGTQWRNPFVNSETKHR